MQCWNDPDHQPDECGGAKREGEYGEVDDNRAQPRQLRWTERHQPLYADLRHRYAKNASYDGKEKTFREQLADESRSSRSKCGPHREFPLPLCTPRKQEVGHVYAGDQEHQDHCTENGQQRGFDTACDFVLKRIDDEPVVEGRSTRSGKVRYRSVRDAAKFPFGMIYSEA